MKRLRHILGCVTLMGCFAFYRGRDERQQPRYRAESELVHRSIRCEPCRILSFQSATSREGEILRQRDWDLGGAALLWDRCWSIPDRVQGEIPMQDLPVRITEDIPMVQGEKFVKIENTIEPRLLIHQVSWSSR